MRNSIKKKKNDRWEGWRKRTARGGGRRVEGRKLERDYRLRIQGERRKSSDRRPRRTRGTGVGLYGGRVVREDGKEEERHN